LSRGPAALARPDFGAARTLETPRGPAGGRRSNPTIEIERVYSAEAPYRFPSLWAWCPLLLNAKNDT
jgi:hypothetical protein